MTPYRQRTDHRAMDGHDPKCATFRALPKRNTYHKHTNTTHHIPSTTRRTPPHTGEAMSPACGGARLDTTPEHQTNGARRPRRTTRAAQSKSVAIAARAPQKRSQPQTRAARSPQPPRLSFRPARRIASCLAFGVRNPVPAHEQPVRVDAVRRAGDQCRVVGARLDVEFADFARQHH